jgi:hypothetical protein
MRYNRELQTVFVFWVVMLCGLLGRYWRFGEKTLPPSSQLEGSMFLWKVGIHLQFHSALLPRRTNTDIFTAVRTSKTENYENKARQCKFSTELKTNWNIGLLSNTDVSIVLQTITQHSITGNVTVLVSSSGLWRRVDNYRPVGLYTATQPRRTWDNCEQDWFRLNVPDIQWRLEVRHY